MNNHPAGWYRIQDNSGIKWFFCSLHSAFNIDTHSAYFQLFS